MAAYGNYILTEEQIDTLMAQESAVYSAIAKGNIANRFRIADRDNLNLSLNANPPMPALHGSTLGDPNTQIRELWAKVLIHFYNYLIGNAGNVSFNDIAPGESIRQLSYNGNQYLQVKDLPIYEESEDGNPVLRAGGVNSTLKGRGDLILFAYRRTWGELYNNIPDDFPTRASYFDEDDAFGSNSFNKLDRRAPSDSSDGGLLNVNLIENFIEAARPLGNYFVLAPKLDNFYIYRAWVKLTALHTALYGHTLGSSANNLLSGIQNMPILPVLSFAGKDAGPQAVGDPLTAARLFVNVVRGIEVLFNQAGQQAQWAQQAADAAAAAQDQQELAEAENLGFTIINLPTEVKEQMISNSNNAANKFFTNTFSNELIAMVPLIYNFYLTSEYFSGIDEAFQNPKDRVLDIILSTIANDNNFDATPDLSRPAANSAVTSATGQDQQAAFNSAARDFILKMLIKTPIDILKGLVELIDPHVAISKVIKTGSGFAFNELAGVIDTVTPTLNEEIANATQDFLVPIEPNLNGEDLVSLLLCIVDAAMKNLPEAPPPAPQIPENFFPRVSIDGIDFTGTVSGMLMMPPSPLGLIYLLLELLKNDVTNQTENISNANTESADAVECTPEPQNLLPEPCDDTE